VGEGFAQLTVAGREATEPWLRLRAHYSFAPCSGTAMEDARTMGAETRLGICTTDGGWPGRTSGGWGFARPTVAARDERGSLPVNGKEPGTRLTDSHN